MDKIVFIRVGWPVRDAISHVAELVVSNYPDGFTYTLNKISTAEYLLTIRDEGGERVADYDIAVYGNYLMLIMPGSAEDAWPYVAASLIEEFGWENVKFM